MGARHAPPLCPCSLSPSLPLCSGLCCVCISLSLWLDFHRFPAGLNHVAPSQEGWFDEGLLDGKAASLKGKATGTLTVSSGTIEGEFRHRLGNAVVKGSALPGSVRYLVPLEGKHTWPDGKLQPSVPPRPVPQTRSSCLWNPALQNQRAVLVFTGVVYEGPFDENGLRHGKGLTTLPSGVTHAGVYEKGRLDYSAKCTLSVPEGGALPRPAQTNCRCLR